MVFSLYYAPVSAGTENMILIPAGEFEMGGKGKHDGKPVHTVYVDAFYIDKYEVTQKEYQEATGENPSEFKGEKRPVEKVTWEEAKRYCEKLGKRLPSEAEWEYAAKGGKDKGEVGGYWYKGNADKKTHPVGKMPPNSLGLYDILGNVWEWVADWYGEDYYKNSSRNNPTGPPDGTEKVLRGGSWGGTPLTVRASFRLKLDPSTRHNAVGFRCASSASSSPIHI
ncbi:MAG: formylglycine-generating enzyme family protein [Nitrospinales bacterium]